MSRKALALQGLSPSVQNAHFLGSSKPKDIMDLAGNAFNGAVVMACVLSMIGAGPLEVILQDADIDGVPDEDTSSEGEGQESQDCCSFTASSERSP